MAWAAAPANRAAAAGSTESRSRQSGRRTQGGQSEAGHPDRMARHRQRRQHVVDQPESAVDHRCQQARPSVAVGTESGAGRVHRALQQDGVVIERVGQRDRRVNPAQSVAVERHRPQRRRSDAEGMDRRTDIVHEAGFGQLGTARSAAWRRVAFDDEDASSGTGDRDRCHQPVGPGPDDDRVVIHGVPRPRRPRLAAPRLAPRRSHRHGLHKRPRALCASSMSSTGESRRTSSSAPRC